MGGCHQSAIKKSLAKAVQTGRGCTLPKREKKKPWEGRDQGRAGDPNWGGMKKNEGYRQRIQKKLKGERKNRLRGGITQEGCETSFSKEREVYQKGPRGPPKSRVLPYKLKKNDAGKRQGGEERGGGGKPERNMENNGKSTVDMIKKQGENRGQPPSENRKHGGLCVAGVPG